MASIKQHWLKHADPHPLWPDFVVVPDVVCADGFRMSVQASRLHHCTPQAVLSTGDYTHWEVGFPSQQEDALAPYHVGLQELLGHPVYYNVPTEVIEAIIAAHGGMVGPPLNGGEEPYRQ